MLDEPFDLPVTYKDQELTFSTTLRQAGYIHRFEVAVHGEDVLFERDEEGAYRAIVGPDADTDNLDVALLQAIAEAIQDVLK